MPDWQIIALVAGGGGLLLGILVARRSHRDNPLHSAIGHIFHYLAATTVVAVPLSIITGIVIGNLRTGVRFALGALVATIVLVVLYAIPESMARRGKPGLVTKFGAVAWERWVDIAKPIGDFNAWLLMGLFYFTVLLPFGALSRLFSDRLRLKKVPEGQPLWLERDRSAELTIDEARRQF